MKLGVNLSFAVKRWPEPDAWARIVREDLDLRYVQFSYDLLDPALPEPARRGLAAQVRQAARGWELEIDSAFTGLGAYCSNGLLSPDAAARRAALEWWKRAFDTAAGIGARAAGGALGAMSVADAADPVRRQRLYRELLDSVAELSRSAAAAGLDHFLIECMPVRREIPSSIEEARQLMADLDGGCRLLIDVGHALHRPLYGADVTMADWLGALGPHIGAFHLQNTDFQSDSHWGWPHESGLFDVAAFAAQADAAGLDRVPAYLEVFYPFEMADDAVRANVISSVRHCRVA